MRHRCVLFLVGVLVAVTMMALAQEAVEVKPGRPPGNREPRAVCTFPAPDPLAELLDTNHDGEVSAEEIAAVGDRVHELDEDGNRRVTRDELPASRIAMLGTSRENLKLLDRFDENHNGLLDRAERPLARQHVRQKRPAWPVPTLPLKPTVEAGPPIRPTQVTSYAGAAFYDESVLRTVFLDFDSEDWEAELADFHRTDVDLPATLTVDGREYANVGVRFRGNSSYFGVLPGQKRSLNLTLDLVDRHQHLGGLRTIELLNAHTDPSFLRTVLYNRIAREYIPAPQSNWVRLVINGQNWGVYVNNQQFNKEFTEYWFATRGGTRWKVPAGGGALSYLGEDRAAYAGYELKSKSNETAWRDLIRLCQALETTPRDELDSRLDELLDIDRALWFLALDNVLMDMDGYHARGSDYLLFQDPEHARFHVLPYDSNETFRPAPRLGAGGIFIAAGPVRFDPATPQGDIRGDIPGGALTVGGPSGAPGVFAISGAERASGDEQEDKYRFALDPLAGADNPQLPLLHRLLANPRLRARYVAHVRTIARDWLEWEKIGPIIESYHQLIDTEVKADPRKLEPYESFAESIAGDYVGFSGTPGLRPMIEGRAAYLREHPELARPFPRIETVTQRVAGGKPREKRAPVAGERVVIEAALGDDVPVESVWLHHAVGRHSAFSLVEMFDDGQHDDGAAGDRLYAAELSGQDAGTLVRWYVEARAPQELGTTVFSPERAEIGAVSYRVRNTQAHTLPLRINEVMPENTRTIRDPAGGYSDWIELVNISADTLDLTGLYLSDSKATPRKWRFPTGTKLAPGAFLLVWADGLGDGESGLHANFKLAAKREALYLVGRDEDGNPILDRVEWAHLRANVSYGRRTDGTGEFEPRHPTPGKPNR